MGDLRILRNLILHAKGIVRSEEYKKLKKLTNMFTVDRSVHISYENMHKIFVLIKQDCARMLFEGWGIKNVPIQPDEIKDVAIQNWPLFREKSI